jgi:hypothetical protein
MRRVICVIALLCAGALVMPGSAPAKYWHGCGDDTEQGYGWNSLRAHNAPCYVARFVANRYTFHYGESIEGGWHCRDDFVPPEGFKAKCHRNHNGTPQMVKFKGGA